MRKRPRLDVWVAFEFVARSSDWENTFNWGHTSSLIGKASCSCCQQLATILAPLKNLLGFTTIVTIIKGFNSSHFQRPHGLILD